MGNIVKSQKLNHDLLKTRLKEVEVDLNRVKRETDTIRIDRDHAYALLTKEYDIYHG